MRAAHPLGLSLVLACSGAQRSEPEPKVVEAPRATPSTANVSAAQPVPPWLTAALAWPSLTSEPVRSSHLARPQLGEIRVNPEARAAYLALVADSEFPLGTRLVEVHRDATTRQSGPIFTLVREPAGWEFAVFDAAGHPAGDAGAAQCAACHAGAAAAPVFGLARDVKIQELNATPPRSPE